MEESSKSFDSFCFVFPLPTSPLHFGIRKIIYLLGSSLNSLTGQIDVSHWPAGSHFISAVVIVLVPSCQVGREWLISESQVCSWPFLAGGQQSMHWCQCWLIRIQFVQGVSFICTTRLPFICQLSFFIIVFFTPIIIITKDE